MASFEAEEVYNQADADGFIKLNALRLRRYGDVHGYDTQAILATPTGISLIANLSAGAWQCRSVEDHLSTDWVMAITVCGRCLPVAFVASIHVQTRCDDAIAHVIVGDGICGLCSHSANWKAL